MSQTTHIQAPGLFKPFNCTKIQLYIDDRPIFAKGHINWANNLTNRRYIWETQCDMVADVGDSKRENIGNFPRDKIQHGRWFAYIDDTPNRKKGISNTVRKIDGIFSARIWFGQTNNANRRQLDSDVCEDYSIYFLKKMSCMETSSLEFLKKDFDVDDPFSNDFRVWEKVHSTFPKTLDKISHDVNFNHVTDERLVKLIRDTLKESKQICKPRKNIKMSVSRKRKHLY